MRNLLPVVLALLLVVCVTSLSAVEFKQKWVYYSGGVRDAASVDRIIDFMKQAKALGVTHMQFNDGSTARLAEMPPEYFDNVKRVLDASKEIGITLVPGIFSIGYSGRYMSKDGNLAAGIPVKDAPFIVKDGVARPDPLGAPTLANGGFDDADADKLAGWTRQDFPGVHTFVDKEVTHSGAASLKVTNLDKLPAAVDGVCRVGQTIKVVPFQYYKLSLWVKADNIQAEKEDYILLISGGGQRRHCYANLRIGRRGHQDDEEQPTEPGAWQQCAVSFNSFEATSIDFSVGVTLAKGGTIWFDDVTIEPAGLAWVVKREITPLTVTNEDKRVVYVEGKDFEAIPGLQSTGPINSDDLTSADIVITKDSAIKDGQKLLVSFFHAARIYDSQIVASVQADKILELMDDEMMRVAKALPADAYFMNYDEIRGGGWELQPAGENLTLGQMLARHVAKAVAMVHKYAPKAQIYVWSDMFDKFHNARPFSGRNGFYYLCNGNWDGSWEGLPREVNIMNWNGTENAAASLKWFGDMGRHQVIAGYYDGDPKENIGMWMKAGEGVPNIDGMMYTTWRRNYDLMPEFFKILDEWPSPAAPKSH